MHGVRRLPLPAGRDLPQVHRHRPRVASRERPRHGLHLDRDARAYHPAFDPPYAVAIIELDEGPRLYSNVLGVDPHAIVQGLPVQVDFEDLDGEHTSPVFRAV